MTGTAATEEAEFIEIYGLDVVSIPPNKPLIRNNMPDSIWKTEEVKFGAVVEEIIQMHQMGRPVLVGTRSVEKSEMLSGMLQQRGDPPPGAKCKIPRKGSGNRGTGWEKRGQLLLPQIWQGGEQISCLEAIQTLWPGRP